MMRSILLKNVVLDGRCQDVLISGNRFHQISSKIEATAERVIDGRGKLALIPPFYNLHSHAAMTLLRGYADDMELFTWLQKYIWPAEALLTHDDVYWGTKLALLEMIRSGTVFVNDMYWHQTASLDAVEEMGLRAAIGYMFICVPGGGVLESNRQANAELKERVSSCSSRIHLTYAPHAIYTVNQKALLEIAEEAKQDQAVLHIHAAETAREVEECQAEHSMTPIAYLDSLGMLGPKTVLAHCAHLTNEDIALISERGAVIAHNPVSNMKLCSGLFRFQAAWDAGCRIGIGTDGCASNNNLSMLEEMKFAALSAKVQSGEPTAGNDRQIFSAATRTGCSLFDMDGGEIAVGKLADALLVRLDHPQMLGDYNLTANLVYSADNSVIDTLICDGKILMEEGKIDGEQEILARNREICRKIAAVRPG
ncbi:MAG: amidohydrolase [Lentisphaerae bacterium]|jgi:5-methylthioadenosine/S-adenosylhomocysteine deaminase|nr:amidohydrolase [Lentisphaerota bacterium]